MDQNTNFKRKQVSEKRMAIWGRVVGPNKLDALESWLLVRRWIDEHGFDRTMELAVGGDDRVGDCELAVLDHFGFRDGDYLIDVGCGSGRLTRRIAKLPDCHYLGTDINRAMVNHARATCRRSDFRFARIDGLKIPEEDGKADTVAFFSVGTHLLRVSPSTP
jgi:SAM-dependent methyltransferase